jgi:hypothetical protein
MASIAAGPVRGLAGDLRISGSVLRGTRTEWLPFPCHPRSHAFLADLDPTMPVQYWEETCATEGCGMEYRFEHVGRHLSWYPIAGLTDPGSPQAVPLDPQRVEVRLRREGRGSASNAPSHMPGTSPVRDSVEITRPWPMNPAHGGQSAK